MGNTLYLFAPVYNHSMYKRLRQENHLKFCNSLDYIVISRPGETRMRPYLPRPPKNSPKWFVVINEI